MLSSGKGRARRLRPLIPPSSTRQTRREASLAQQNEVNFANTAFNRQLAALHGLGGLFGMDTNLLARTLGLPAELLNVRANASRGGSGFFSSLGSSIGNTFGALPGMFF